MAIIYTNQSSGRKRKRKKVPARLAQAREEHQKFITSLGCFRPHTGPIMSFPDLSVKVVSPMSNNLYVGGGFKHSIDDYKWRRDQTESKETIEAIQRKKTKIAPLYNKGPAAYITDGEDLKTLGRKV
jgi:hypothetical protein